METRYDYVIVGGGVTSAIAAQNIRENDKEGTIVIVGQETHPPYDRPPLSKNMLTNDEMAIDDPYSKFDNFYPDNNIELRRQTRVTGIDSTAKTLALEGGETLSYGKLLLATGSTPRSLPIPGADLPGVHLLRTIDDSLSIREALKRSSHLVVIGAGYIGMEVASGAKKRGLDVTIVAPEKRPWQRMGSEEFGGFIQQTYEAQGVHFFLEDEVVAIEQNTDGAGLTVVTKNGQRLPADMVVAGIGVDLNTELAQQAGLEVDAKNGVFVDKFLHTSDPFIWAAGDIAYFDDVALGIRWHAEHHLNARWQGQAVGKIMAGGTEPYDRVAYFFSDVFDLHLILRGNPNARGKSVLLGDLEGGEFVEIYYDDSGKITLGVAVSHDEPRLDKISDALETLIRAGRAR